MSNNLFFQHNHMKKVFIIALCIAMLDSLVFSAGTKRRNQQKEILNALAALLKDVRKEVPQEAIKQEQKTLWKNFQAFQFPKWLHETFCSILQEIPKPRKYNRHDGNC